MAKNKSKKKCPFKPAGDPIDITFDALNDATTLPGVSHDDAMMALGQFVKASIATAAKTAREEEGNERAADDVAFMTAWFARAVAEAAKIGGACPSCVLEAILKGVENGLDADVEELLRKRRAS